MDYSEKLALFLGMLSGDGCLSIKHNGEGYRDYPIEFCNTDIKIVQKFRQLLFDLFELNCKIYSYERINRKKMWQIIKHSVKVYNYLKGLGFPKGVKRDILKVPKCIFIGTFNEKLAFFYGVLITDGCLKPNRGIMFHSGSKSFLEDLSVLISDFIGSKKKLKNLYNVCITNHISYI